MYESGGTSAKLTKELVYYPSGSTLLVEKSSI